MSRDGRTHRELKCNYPLFNTCVNETDMWDAKGRLRTEDLVTVIKINLKLCPCSSNVQSQFNLRDLFVEIILKSVICFDEQCKAHREHFSWTLFIQTLIVQATSALKGEEREKKFASDLFVHISSVRLISHLHWKRKLNWNLLFTKRILIWVLFFDCNAPSGRDRLKS